MREQTQLFESVYSHYPSDVSHLRSPVAIESHQTDETDRGKKLLGLSDKRPTLEVIAEPTSAQWLALSSDQAATPNAIEKCAKFPLPPRSHKRARSSDSRSKARVVGDDGCKY